MSWLLCSFGPKKDVQCWNCKRDSYNWTYGKRVVVFSSYLQHLRRFIASVNGQTFHGDMKTGPPPSPPAVIFEVPPSALQWADEASSALWNQLCSGFIRKQDWCDCNVYMSEWQALFVPWCCWDGRKPFLFSKNQGSRGGFKRRGWEKPCLLWRKKKMLAEWEKLG